MNINKENALRLWDKRYGKEMFVQDCYGKWICRDDYGNKDLRRLMPGTNKERNYGWDIDHIYPQMLEANNDESNLEIISISYNGINKGSRLTYHIKKNTFQIVRRSGKPGYGIQNQKTKEMIDWISKH